MKATIIYPEDIGTSQWSDKWLTFIKKFGYEDSYAKTPWSCLTLINIEILS